MNKTFTINYIIKYLYGELPPKASVQWMERIMSDRDLREEFEALAEVKNLIDNSTIHPPSQSVIENILAEIVA